MFEPIPRLLIGLLTGVAFGFLLQKGQVTKYRVIVGQFLLRDFRMLKVMGSAVAVGSVGIYAMAPLGLVSLHIKPAALGGLLLGGTLFGVGMALLGYCPGTGVAACGEGRRDAMVGVLGMIAGAGAYVVTEPMVRSLADRPANLGQVTLPQLTHTPAWPWVLGLALAITLLAAVSLRSQRQRRAGDQHG